MTTREFYSGKVSSDIMYNESRHIVSVFKDFLIFDDFSEYLKRKYQRREIAPRLNRIISFFNDDFINNPIDRYIPSYVSLPEAKFMLKNSDKKLKLLAGVKSPENIKSPTRANKHG